MEEVKIVLSQKRTEEEELEELARVLLVIAKDLSEKGLEEKIEADDDHA